MFHGFNTGIGTGVEESENGVTISFPMGFEPVTSVLEVLHSKPVPWHNCADTINIQLTFIKENVKLMKSECRSIITAIKNFNLDMAI